MSAAGSADDLGSDEHAFRIAMELSPIGFCLVATDGAFLRVNEAMCELLGRDEQTLKTATWQEVTHPDDVDADQRLVDDVLDGNCDGYRIVKRYLRPDGTVVWGDLSVRAVRNDEGAARYFISQIVDVTQAHSAQEALARQRDYLHAAMDSELDSRVLVAPVRDESGSVMDLVYVDANSQALTELGMSREEIVGARMSELPEQRRFGLFNRYVNTMETGDPLILDEVELPGGTGGAMGWFDVRAIRVDDTLNITWRDVSERHHSRVALAESEARYQLLAQNSSDVISMGNNAGVLTWVSDSVTHRLGWYPADLVGHQFAEFVHEDDRAHMRAVQDELNAGHGGQMTVRVADRTGRFRWFSILVRPQFDDEGRVIGRVAGWRDVHDEREAEKELEESRAVYQLVAENAADVVLLMDADGQITWLSPSIQRLTGWPAENLTGLQAWSLVHPDDAEKVRALAASVLESTTRAEVQARLHTRHGDYRHWHISMRRTSKDGEAELVAALRDVNDQVLARQEADRESARRKALLNSMFDPHVLLQAVRDDAGNVVDFVYADANDAACEYNQIAREDLVGASLMQLLPGHRGTELFAAYCNTIDTGEPLVLDDYVYPHEILAEPRHYDIRAVRVEDSLSFTWRDVTERSLLAEQLATSEERFRLIATNTSDIIGVADMYGTLEWVSPSVTPALGWGPEQLIGQGVYDIVHPDDMEKVLDGQAEVADGREGTVRARVRDIHDTYHWAEVRAAPIINESNSIMGITAAVSIVDDRVAWEEALRHQASHDPLTGLLNREEMYRRLGSMLSHPPRVGVRTFLAFLDLDNMKRTNDELGHAAGDELIRLVARRTQQVLRDGDHIARVGGDELLVILPGVQDSDAALTLAHRLLKAVSEPHPFEDQILRPRMSIGLAEVHPGDDIESAVNKADTAMYRAKAAGGHQVQFAE